MATSVLTLISASAGVVRGECEAALSAGVNAMLSPKTAMKICQLQVPLPHMHPAMQAFCKVIVVHIKVIISAWCRPCQWWGAARPLTTALMGMDVERPLR